jgi:hypothetical protein
MPLLKVLANLKYNTNSPLQCRAQPLVTLRRKWGDATGRPEEKVSTDGERPSGTATMERTCQISCPYREPQEQR